MSPPTELPPEMRKTRRKSLDTFDPIQIAKDAANLLVNPNDPNIMEQLKQLQSLRYDLKNNTGSDTSRASTPETEGQPNDLEIKNRSSHLMTVHKNRRKTWGVETGVGSTALWTAAMRKAETSKENAKFYDDYAEIFVTEGSVAERIETEIATATALFQNSDPKNPEVDNPRLKMKYLFNNFLGKRYLRKMRDRKVTQEQIKNSLEYHRLNMTKRTCYLDREVSHYSVNY